MKLENWCFWFDVVIDISKELNNGVKVEYVDISPLPMLNTDLEVNGKFPAAVEAFRTKIAEADCYLFASPEYNFSVTGSFIMSLVHVLLIHANIANLGNLKSAYMEVIPSYRRIILYYSHTSYCLNFDHYINYFEIGEGGLSIVFPNDSATY